mgnify:CR=1 FL=1
MAIKLFDKYSLKARVLPAAFTILIPLIIFNHFFTSPSLKNLLGAFKGSESISNISISLVLMFYLSQIARLIGKNMFEKRFFNDELKMPTTEFMLYSNNQYSDDYKERFASKVKSKFDITLYSKNLESTDEQTARKRIVEAMSSVRKDIFKNTFLLQHNIEYGAMRNTIGGSLIGLTICIINYIFFLYIVPVDFAVYSSAVLGVIYAIFILFSKSIINSYGKAYAKILFREFIG